MKIVLETFGMFKIKKTLREIEEIRPTTKSRRYQITDAEDLPW